MIMNKYFFITILILFFSYYLIIQLPLMGDEALYSIAIKDNIELGLQPTATYFGETMYWKPALMFNVYGILASPFYKIISEEILFRTVSLLFVILSLFVLFKFFKEEFQDENKAYWGLIILLITPAFFSYSLAVITDTLTFFFFCLMLFSIQKFEKKENKIIFLFSLLGIGLSKSVILIVLGIIMSIVYYLQKNKKINKELVVLSVIPLIFIFIYSAYIGNQNTNSEDIMRMFIFDLNFERYLGMLVRLIMFGGAIFFFSYNKNNLFLSLICLSFLLYLILNINASLPWYVFPILPFLIINTLSYEKKELIFVLLIYNFFFISAVFGNLYNLNQTMYKIAYSEEFNNTIFIGRGEIVADKIYNTNGVMVTPQNSFCYDTEQGILLDGFNVKEKMTKENLLGLIYDYDNPEWYPKYLGDAEEKFRYLPPVTRTHKTFDDQFEQIIIEEQYYVKIKEEILKDYEINKIYYKEIDEDQTIYILKRK